MKNIIKLLTSFIVLSISFEVLAIDMDYYAPNGMPTIADAFTRLALIFSDGDYYFALPIIGALALVISVINGYLVKPLSTGNPDRPINIFAPLAIGTVIWVSGFVPTATLHIYDPVKNDTQSVPGIPQVIVLAAGLTNILERNMIEITDTGTAYSYTASAGGINLETFLNVQYKAHTNRKKFLGLDLESYYEDCGKVNMVITGNQTFEDLSSNTEDIYTLISEWTHPSLFTNMYNTTPGKTNSRNSTLPKLFILLFLKISLIISQVLRRMDVDRHSNSTNKKHHRTHNSHCVRDMVNITIRRHPTANNHNQATIHPKCQLFFLLPLHFFSRFNRLHLRISLKRICICCVHNLIIARI